MTFYNNKAGIVIYFFYLYFRILHKYNISAVFFGEGKFKECISQCNKAVDVGREHGADSTQFGKLVI